MSALAREQTSGQAGLGSGFPLDIRRDDTSIVTLAQTEIENRRASDASHRISPSTRNLCPSWNLNHKFRPALPMANRTSPGRRHSASQAERSIGH
jgi:hypothetical protein